HALRGAKHADETAMVMPLVLEQLSNADDTIRGTAAALLTEYYFLARQWDAIADLLDSDSETVRPGALGTLDDLAEAADHTDNDLTPLVPSLLRVFARKGSDYKKHASPRGARPLLAHLTAGQSLRVEWRRPHGDCRGARRAQKPQAPPKHSDC